MKSKKDGAQIEWIEMTASTYLMHGLVIFKSLNRFDPTALRSRPPTAAAELIR